MGRGAPFPSEAHPLAHPALVIPLVVAWIAAAMAVFGSVCATCNRKPATTSPPSSPTAASKESDPKPASDETSTTAPAVQALAEQDQENPHAPQEGQKPVTVIEMAPDVATHGPIPPTVLPVSASKRKLSLSLSKGVLPDKLRVVASKRERKNDSEDSLWKKTIILGEKCKVASDDEEEEVEVVDEKGNRQRYYHPRTPKSRQTSRNNSFACTDERPSTS